MSSTELNIYKNHIYSYILALSYTINNLLDTNDKIDINLFDNHIDSYKNIYKKLDDGIKIKKYEKLNTKIDLLYTIYMSYIFFYLLKYQNKDKLKSKKDNEYIIQIYNYLNKEKQKKYNDLHTIFINIIDNNDIKLDKDEFKNDNDIKELLDKL